MFEHERVLNAYKKVVFKPHASLFTTITSSGNWTKSPITCQVFQGLSTEHRGGHSQTLQYSDHCCQKHAKPLLEKNQLQ